MDEWPPNAALGPYSIRPRSLFVGCYGPKTLRCATAISVLWLASAGDCYARDAAAEITGASRHR
jgi:hypothetical protein